MRIMAIDPGPEESAFVRYDTESQTVTEFGKFRNDVLIILCAKGPSAEQLVIEMVASYGMPVGREVFETVFWAGRFWEAWGSDERRELLYRRDVKLHMCGQPRAKDSNIRQALIDKFGGKAETKKGGKLYGVKADIWQALALAVTYAETRIVEPLRITKTLETV